MYQADQAVVLGGSTSSLQYYQPWCSDTRVYVVLATVSVLFMILATVQYQPVVLTCSTMLQCWGQYQPRLIALIRGTSYGVVLSCGTRLQCWGVVVLARCSTSHGVVVLATATVSRSYSWYQLRCSTSLQYQAVVLSSAGGQQYQLDVVLAMVQWYQLRLVALIHGTS